MGRYGSHDRPRQAPRIGTETYLKPTDTQDTLLWDLCALWGRDERRVYARIYDHHAKWFVSGGSGLRNQLMAEGWLRQEADAIHWAVTARQASLTESLKLHIANDKLQLTRLERKLDKTRQPKHRHTLAIKRDRTCARLRRNLRNLREGSQRVVFGGRKLANAGNDPQTHGFESREQWRIAWDRSRSNHWACQGNIIATGGNAAAQLVLDEDGDYLRLHIPAQVLGGKRWVEIPVAQLSYRRQEYAIVAGPDIDYNESKGKGQRRRLASSPISYQLCWSEAKQRWYIKVGWETVRRAPISKRPNRVGVDVNPSHLALALMRPDGNPVAWKRVDLDLSGTKCQIADNVGCAVASAVAWAASHDASLVLEDLDFTRSRTGLADLPSGVARLLSGFAYGLLRQRFVSRAYAMGVLVQFVDPAYTSTLGRLNVAGVFGVSVDQAAAAVIARRGLGLCERVRPSVACQYPGCGIGGRADLVKIHNCLRRVSRATTWDKESGLLRHSLPGYAVGRSPEFIGSGSFSARVNGPMAGCRYPAAPPGVGTVVVNNGQ